MLEPGDELDAHLDRLMESAYAALGSRDEAAAVVTPPPTMPERIGPYPVTGLLGRGGTSLVWRGFDPELGREIAIKVVDPRHAPGGGLAQRFLDEARLCSGLAHPGIVPIHTIGALPDGRPWFTMRLIEGDTLAQRLAARDDPTAGLQQFLEIFARTCETVAFAHARGVVHGDLKPANVMVAAYGQVHVVDWGFSRLVDEPAGAPRRGAGTPAFMAPEQAAPGGAIDPRTDVFGLGAILCVILTGAPPYVGGTRSELQVRAAHADLDGARERLRACRADAELVQLALDCLHAPPADRPRDAAAVAARVSAWFASIERRAHRLELAAAQARVAAREQRRTRRRTIALAVLAVAFGVVYAWMQFDRQARDFEARTAVLQALERARGHSETARTAGRERLRWLGAAASAAQQARTFAATIADDRLRADADELARRCEEDRDTAVADARMAEWLEDFPSHLDLTREQLDAHYAAGFRAYGVDVETLPDTTAASRLRDRSIAPALARALDDWGLARRLLPGDAGAEWRRFHELAIAVDTDPRRAAVRRALLADDRPALLRLAADPAWRDADSDALDLLANCLDRAGERPAAIDVWQRANERSPGDVRVLHSLAVHHFGAAGSPPWAEIVRLLTAATALRPHSAHLWTDLTHALLGSGEIAAAEAALQRALALDVRDERAHASLVDLWRCRCRPAAALEQSARIAERAGDGPGWRVHGDACLLDGHVEAAVTAYRRAVAAEPSAFHHERLGQALLALGDADAAARSFDDAITLDTEHAAAHAHLGLALRARGKFADALRALEQGRELGGAAWAARCSTWLAETERAAANSAGADTTRPDPAARDRVELAAVAHVSGDAARAARLYHDAFTAEPRALDGRFFGWHLERATLAAATVAADAATSAAEQQRWRAQAVAWLRLAIGKVDAAFTAGRETPATVRLRLSAWRHAPELTAVRAEVRTELDALAARVDAGASNVTVQAPFAAELVFRELGSPPGVLAPFGGVLIEANDPDVLVVAGHAQRRTASLHAIDLARGADGHATGFRGDARRLAAAPFADGGLLRGPRGELVYTRYPNAELGVIRPGEPGPERVLRLAGASAGGLQRVPPGLPGAGRVKLLAWPGGEWSDAEVAARDGALELTNERPITTLPGGPDGCLYVPAGRAPFSQPTLLVAEWSAHTIAAYDVDGNGDPVPATRRVVATGCRGVLGLTLDPPTGDVLVSTWRGDGTEGIGLLLRTVR